MNKLIHKYHVYVSNVGSVYAGDSLNAAKKEMAVYIQLSMNAVGRASGEDVILKRYGEIAQQYAGFLSEL